MRLLAAPAKQHLIKVLFNCNFLHDSRIIRLYSKYGTNIQLDNVPVSSWPNIGYKNSPDILLYRYSYKFSKQLLTAGQPAGGRISGIRLNIRYRYRILEWPDI
jgi:hypothetical protein